MTDRFTCHERSDRRWVLRRNGTDVVEGHEASFPTLKSLKNYTWVLLGVVPEAFYHNTESFDETTPLHAALSRIETRSSPFQIVSVGPEFYYVRRGRFSVELPVRYMLKDGKVSARNDTEFLEMQDEH